MEKRRKFMKTNSLRILCALLASLMILAALASCGSCVGNVEDETTNNGQETTEGNQETTDSQGSDTTTESGQGGDTTESGGDETEESGPAGIVDADHGDLIELSNSLKNGVNPYFTDASKEQLTIENQVMNLGYGMVGMSGNSQVQHLSTKDGIPYIQNTMDIVLNMKNGKSYYASKSLEGSILNIYRYGYYFYETRIEGQTFVNELVRENELKYDLSKGKSLNMYSAKFDKTTGVLSAKHNNHEDPQIRFSEHSFAISDYDYLQFKMRVSEEQSCTVYLLINEQFKSYNFTSVPGDEFVTYTVPLSEFPAGNVTMVRLDINGSNLTNVELSELTVFEASFGGAPVDLTLQRSFYTYSDKLHHVVQLSTKTAVVNVASVDMVTRISADTVDKIIVKDKNGLKDTLDGVDWASVEFVGFDIKGAGIFGYIMPTYDETIYKNNYHAGVGSLNVTLSDGVYTITQSKVPEGNQLVPSANHTLNANDFYMGQRIYTDENHTFDEFIMQATIERNPLTSENITVDTGFDSATYAAYDSLRGCYVFTLTGSNFQKSYHLYPNRQYRVVINVKGDEYDRQMYFMTHMDDNGSLECATLLGNGDMLLPVPIEVCKNFGGDGENTIYNLDDAKYAETYFPMVIKAGKEQQYTIVHLYQNWGIFPLKQISSIQYYTPFYHLSTGVTETNCIVPFADAGPKLPDHRAMSAPFWTTQPQHTSGGSHVFLHFTNEEGNTVVSGTTYAKIDSYGPTYCDIDLGYVSSDGRIEANYTHMEFPQTDENRAFYTLSYEFKEDVSFTDFAHQFKFYRCSSNATGNYSRIGYLDENNKSQVVDASYSSPVGYVLGDNCPYFSFFDMRDCAPDISTHTGYVNISFLIKDAEIICNGEKITPDFYIYNYTMGDSSVISLSLDLDEVTFKKGDTIKINAIIMPWGSHLLNDGIENFAEGQYEYTSVIGTDENGDPIYYMDKNVRDVREDSLLNPFRATALNNAEILDSVWIPKIKTTDGKSAEFTVSGGNNNCVVRVYGFQKLTSPVIEEFVNGKWMTYRVASASKKDDRGYGYFYDGYMVHYDEDGTYSYSFVIPMDKGAERKFRVTAEADFKAWPEVQYDENANNIKTEGDPLNVYIDANELVSFKDDTIPYLTDLQLITDEGDFPFARYIALDGVAEAIIYPFELSHDAYTKLESTGQYAVIKYRIPKTDENSPDRLKNFQFFMSTKNERPVDNNESFSYANIKQDGEWHVLILDLSKVVQNPAVHFQPNEKGEYVAQYLRIDIINNAVTSNMYVDLAYVGLCDNLEEIYELAKDEKEVILISDKATETLIDPNTGKMPAGVKWRVTLNKILLDGVQISNLTSISSPAVIDGSKITLTGTSSLGISGWFMAESGISEYKYKIIGTTTTEKSFGAGSSKEAGKGDGDAYIAIAENLGLSAEALKGVTFGKELYFDLSGFEKQTVKIEFIAVTNNGKEIVAAIFNSVTVPEGNSTPAPNPGTGTEPEPELTSQWRVNLNKILLDGVKIYNLSSISTPAVIDATNITLTGTSSLGVYGWFMAESGIAEYKYNIIGSTTVTKSFGKGDNKKPGVGDGDAYVEIATGLGLTQSALDGVTFGKDKYFNLSGFEGQVVTVQFVAVTNDGKEIIAAIFNNVKVP